MIKIIYDSHLNDIEDHPYDTDKGEYEEDEPDEEVVEHDITDCYRCGSNQTVRISERTYRCLEEGCGCVFEIEYELGY